MRYLYLLFFLSLHSYFAFADSAPGPQCTGLVGSPNVCGFTPAQAGGLLSERTSACTNAGNKLVSDGVCSENTQGRGTPKYKCYLSCACPDGFILNTFLNASTGAWETECVSAEPTDEPEECEAPNVKNIETGACEPKTDCEYPLLYDSYSNSCFANPNHCAEGSKPNPIDPGTCIAYGDTSCPNGWVPINDGLNCAPGGNASSAAGASSAPPASSAAAASSTPASTPASTPTSSPSSTPSDGGDDSGSGDGGGGGSGSGGNSGTGGTGSGSASSSNSSGAGSGSGSGGSGECDPTSPDYLDCISRDTGDEGEGLDEVNQKDYGLNIGDRLQQARDDYTDRLNQIQDEFSQSVSVSLGSGSGSLPRNTVTLYGESVEMGIYARRDFFDAIRWIFLAVATVLSLYIVLSR